MTRTRRYCAFMDQGREWATAVTAGIGERVAHYRDQAKITAQQLAERCAALGMPTLSRVVITKLENGRRESISTAELQVLAAALGVPAIVLLSGLSTVEAVEVLPGASVEPYDAIRWFTGDASEPGSGGPPEGSPVPLYALHHHLVAAWQHDQDVAARALDEVEQAKTPQERLAALGSARLYREMAEGGELRTIRATMRQLGYVPPKLPPHVARALGEEAADGIR
jgi:transcriptional regulator with XRE-family HTH domain